MLYNAGPMAQLLGQSGEIGDGTEVAVENHVAGVGGELRAVGVLANSYAGLQGFQETQLAAPAESQHLYRNRVAGAQAGRELAVIYGDDDAAAGLGNNLFPQQGPAAAFGHVQLRIHFVGAVYSEIN